MCKAAFQLADYLPLIEALASNPGKLRYTCSKRVQARARPDCHETYSTLHLPHVCCVELCLRPPSCCEVFYAGFDASSPRLHATQTIDRGLNSARITGFAYNPVL